VPNHRGEYHHREKEVRIGKRKPRSWPGLIEDGASKIEDCQFIINPRFSIFHPRSSCTQEDSNLQPTD
jgi:hypothetical protein